jgi:hypothetical protein
MLRDARSVMRARLALDQIREQLAESEKTIRDDAAWAALPPPESLEDLLVINELFLAPKSRSLSSVRQQLARLEAKRPRLHVDCDGRQRLLRVQ